MGLIPIEIISGFVTEICFGPDGFGLSYDFGYLKCTIFREIPFALLATLASMPRKSFPKAPLLPVVLGGLIGIYVAVVPLFVYAWQPVYTKGAMSSTWGLNLAFIPFLALPFMLIGVVGGLSFSLLYTVCRSRPATRRQRDQEKKSTDFLS